jgi:hypothetical protein
LLLISSWKYDRDVYCGSRIQEPDFFPFRIPGASDIRKDFRRLQLTTMEGICFMKTKLASEDTTN